MTSSEIKTAVRDYLQAVVSPLLVAAPALTDFEEYIDEKIYSEDTRTLAVYLAQGDDDELRTTETLLIQAQLPGELHPDPYHDVIFQALRDFESTSVGLTTKRTTWQLWYPGELSEGGGSAFIYYELSLSGALDSCS